MGVNDGRNLAFSHNISNNAALKSIFNNGNKNEVRIFNLDKLSGLIYFNIVQLMATYSREK
jgi:hypothetical protein